MNSENTSILSEELKPLNAQIELVQARLAELEGDLRVAEAELETFSTERQRFDILRDVCNALDKLTELEAGELFWDELPEIENGAGRLERLRDRIASFEGEVQAIEETQEAVKSQINLSLDELDILNDQVNEAYAREERRLEEFAIEREVTPVPYRMMIMPWTGDAESERTFRRSILIALLFCIVFGSLIPLVTIPVPDRAEVVVEIPERLAMLVKKEPPKPEPVALPEPPPEEEKLDAKKEKAEKPKEKKKTKKETKVASSSSETKAARNKAENIGVLAFKNSFKDLMDETPIAKLGTEARVSRKSSLSAGQARPQRSLVAMQATGSSGGIAGIASVSRNVGGGGNGDRIGGVGFARVESTVADLVEEEGRPVSDGVGPARTDEEIQIVFDRYKATLYRIYNKELRKDPTLRGKLLLRITIEPGGEVSLCKVESTDLDSQKLVGLIVQRVERFNFGPKDDVPTTTILYPIDFLPAG